MAARPGEQLWLIRSSEPREGVNLRLPPCGANGVCQIVESTGIRNTEMATEPIAVLRSPRKASILSTKEPAMSFQQGEDVVLLGCGFSPAGVLALREMPRVHASLLDEREEDLLS
jgi:hypothetical protein